MPAGAVLGAWQRILPAVILIYSVMLFSPEVRISAAGLNIYSYRMAILPLLAVVVLRYLRGHTRWSLTDTLVTLAAIWMLASFTVHFGVGDGLVRAGALVVDFAGAYFVARVSLGQMVDFRRLLVAIAPGLAVAGALMTLESVSHRLLVRPFWREIFGPLPEYFAGEEVADLVYQNEIRLGLLRSYSVFSHPILGGAVLISAFPLFLFAGLRGWPKLAGLGAALAGFFSLSSAAILGLFLVLGLAALEYLKRSIARLRWSAMAAIGLVLLLAAQLSTANGIVAALSPFTINPATAYIRRVQWQYGLDAVERQPVFGYGYGLIERAAWMTDSIDAHFLVLAIRHGILVPLLLLVAMIGVMVTAGLRAGREAEHRSLLVGYNFCLFTLIFVGMTVTYFGESQIWLMFVLGLGASLIAVPAAPAPPARAA